MRFASACIAAIAAIAGTAEALWSPADYFAQSMGYPAVSKSIPGCYCSNLVNDASAEAASLCQKYSSGSCRPTNSLEPDTDGSKSGVCPDDSFLCDPHKKPDKKPDSKKPDDAVRPEQCPEIRPQVTLDTKAASGEWFVQEASTTAFFDAVTDKCYSQYYLFDLQTDAEAHDREVLFQAYAEKKRVPPQDILEVLKQYSDRYGDKDYARHRKLNSWGYVSFEDQSESEGSRTKEPVSRVPWHSVDALKWVQDELYKGGDRADLWTKFWTMLSNGNGIGNFFMEDGHVTRNFPMTVMPTLMDQIDNGFVDLAICGTYKVSSQFEDILPCGAPESSRLAKPEDAKWFFVFAGSIDKHTGKLVPGLVGDDLFYEYAIVTGGAQVPLSNGKCAPGGGFVNGGFQLLSRHATAEHDAIELLRRFAVEHTNIDLHTLRPVKQAGCTYKDSAFRGKDPFEKSVVKFGQTIYSGDLEFACPEVLPQKDPLTLQNLQDLSSFIQGCYFIYFSTPFSGLDPKLDKCAQQAIFLRKTGGQTFTEAVTGVPPPSNSRQLVERLSTTLFAELTSVRSSIADGVIIAPPKESSPGFSLCGVDAPEATAIHLGSCFADQTKDAPAPGVLFSNWFILFAGFFVPGTMQDGHFVKGFLSTEVGLADPGDGGPFLTPIIIATGGQPVTPTPDGCAAGKEFIDSGLLVSSKDPDGITPEAFEAIKAFLKEKHFDISELQVVKQGVKNGCAAAAPDSPNPVCYLSKPNSRLFNHIEED